MAVKSNMDIKCFKDVKFWVEQSVYIKIYRNHKTFFEKSLNSFLKVTAHTWAIFFPKNRIFSFFDIL